MKLFRSLFSAISIIIIMTLGVNHCYASPFPLQQESSKKKEKVDSIALFGKIYDRETSKELPLSIVTVLNADSTLISTKEAGMEFKNEAGEVTYSTSEYRINIPKIEGSYLIKVSRPGYETKYVPYILSKLHKRDDNREAPKIYLSRERVRTLDEFTVKTSKVKFYNKGDTLVYNADAFMLPEGSMLDALIKQLPGVEIREGGNIYVNGRFVESLLLNGKDFFKKDKNVMLENIGVYTVKDVAVYEKQDEMTEILGKRGDIEKDYVMDVRLKKEFNVGSIINAQAGGGTSSTYLGRLFALRYTDNSRLALYGNANNINMESNLSEYAQEYDNYGSYGLTTKANGGIDYSADNQLHTWEISGNADIKYTDNKNTTITNAINYLQDVNNFEFTNIHNRAKDLSFSTEHNFKLKQKRWNLGLKPSFSYNKNRNNDETVAATFNQEIQDLNESIVKSIYSGDYRNIQSALINRNLKVYEADSHGYDAQLQGSSRIKIPNSPDALEVKFTAQYKRKSLFGNTLQDICFGSLPESYMLQHRFSSNRPQYDFKIQGLGRYYFNIPLGSLNASYEFIHTQNRKNSDIALLEAMAENDMAQFEPGAIPVPDFDNSYTSKLYKNQHILKLTWYYAKKINNLIFTVNLTPKFFLERHDLFYHRANVYADPHRTFTRLNLEELQFYLMKDHKWSLACQYSLKQTAPNLMNMVDIDNTTDPLNIHLGNPGLKNQTSQNLDIYYNNNTSKRFRHMLNFRGSYNSNEFVSGYQYDSDTGARTYRMYNVSGNHILNGNYYGTFTFGPDNRLHIKESLGFGYGSYTMLVGYDNTPEKQKNIILSPRENLSFGYEDNNYTAELSGNILYSRSKSEGQIMEKSNYGNYGFTFRGSARLPLNFQLKTDFNLMKRFGYIENSMNDVNYIWNASLEYLIQKGTWRISLDAKDILNQNKGINYYVNASGRTQTLNTVLPRYLMLSLHYRFDFKPKKRAK